MRLLDVLKIDGPNTSAGLARHLGENTGTVSWHLRHLAEHGFIEEETGRGTRRERWWRAIQVSNELNTADFRNDPQSRDALTLYKREVLRQNFDRIARYFDEDWDDAWRATGTVSAWHELRLSAPQLGAMNAELAAVVERYAQESVVHPQPDALPVVVQLQSFPRRERADG